jgi:putative CocE/NonD family hydrolase
MKKLHRDWFDWTLKGKAKPKFLRQRVTFYEVGPDVWRYAPTLGAVTRQYRILYLNSHGASPNDTFEAGILSETKPGSTEPDRCAFDPLFTPTINPANLQSPVEPTTRRPDRLVYYTEPFEEQVSLHGSAKLVAWISLDVRDTDFSVSLSEVLADGSSLPLSLGALSVRARYRDSLQDENLVEPHQVNRYQFDFGFTAIQLAKGSRLRLSIQAPSPIGSERNYNGGGVVADETDKDAQTAHVALYHDAAHPSFLQLPLGKGSERPTHVAAGQ